MKAGKHVPSSTARMVEYNEGLGGSMAVTIQVRQIVTGWGMCLFLINIVSIFTVWKIHQVGTHPLYENNYYIF